MSGQPVVGGVREVLLATQIALGGGDRGMAKQQLDLLQLSAVFLA
jgi:hypothetical protein